MSDKAKLEAVKLMGFGNLNIFKMPNSTMQLTAIQLENVLNVAIKEAQQEVYDCFCEKKTIMGTITLDDLTAVKEKFGLD